MLLKYGHFLIRLCNCFLTNAYFVIERGSPRNLVTKDITDTSIGTSWTAAPGMVRGYRISWKSLFDNESGEKNVPGDITNAVLDNLKPETKYQISVFADYKSGEGPPLEGEATTEGNTSYFIQIYTYCLTFIT